MRFFFVEGGFAVNVSSMAVMFCQGGCGGVETGSGGWAGGSCGGGVMRVGIGWEGL